MLGGRGPQIKVAHIRLCHSRLFLVRAYPREIQEMVFGAHEHALRFFGGSCRRGIYDNMRSQAFERPTLCVALAPAAADRF